jgi:hypothetical protein
MIPISHCFRYGVVKKFCKLVLPRKPKNKPWEVSAANREAVSARAVHLVLPADSARAYRDIVKYGGSYTMEDYGAFVGTAGLFVLRGLLPTTAGVQAEYGLCHARASAGRRRRSSQSTSCWCVLFSLT